MALHFWIATFLDVNIVISDNITRKGDAYPEIPRGMKHSRDE
jgi:hypothetical protein